MNPISAQIIEDSISTNGCRISTIQLRYPRFIHAEFMTHRVFSRNASSSRAIPVAKMIKQIKENPATPIHWGINQPGMQADLEMTGADKDAAQAIWHEAAIASMEFAEKLVKIGVHKQIANRIIEPFSFISVIVTATEWENFFELRDHPDAQPEIRSLAEKVKQVRASSNPKLRAANSSSPDAWHLPYILEKERQQFSDPIMLAKISAARCARVSYLTHDGLEPSIEKDLALFQKLVGSRPLHASPVEHQAFPLEQSNEWNKNFRGWSQFRSMVETWAEAPDKELKS